MLVSPDLFLPLKSFHKLLTPGQNMCQNKIGICRLRVILALDREILRVCLGDSTRDFWSFFCRIWTDITVEVPILATPSNKNSGEN